MFKGIKTLLLCSALALPATAFAQTTYSSLDQSSTWKGSSSVAVGSTGNTTTAYSMSRYQSNPSLDGASARFFLGGDKPFTNAIWWNLVGSKDTASHFKLDFYYYMKDPGASQAIEFNASQTRGGYRYKFSTQCGFASGVFRVWDTKNRYWVSTSAPCRRLTAYTWHHIIAEYARSNGKALFVAVTVDGQKYYINKSFYPEPYSASAINVHFQLDGNSVQKDYYVWVDKMKLTVW